MGNLWQDLRYAVRVLAKSPGFTAVAVITLALGIGANTAIFSLIDAVMLKMLPVKDPEQLVLFQWDAHKWPPHVTQTGSGSQFSFSYPAFAEFRAQNRALQSVFAFVPLGFNKQNTTVNINGEPTLADGMMVSGSYFSGLGVTPLLGRAITEADEDPSAPRVAVISYSYWTRQFTRDPAIVGKNVVMNGTPFTIVGVSPPAFHGAQPGSESDIWMAFADRANLRPWGTEPEGSESVFTARNWICLNIMGRLPPGVSQRLAEAALDVNFRHFLASDWAAAKPDQLPHLQLVPAAQGVHGLREGYSQPLYLLMGIVGLVLLIACANLATLFLARATARQREVGVRIAVGAGRRRIVRQLLTESVLLATLGGAFGVLLANIGAHALLALMSTRDNPIILDVRPDPLILAFTLLVSLLTGILFGVAPALRAVRIDLASVMKENAGSLSEGKREQWLGKCLVVAQVAASLVLTIGAGLFVRTLINLEHRDLGFNQNNLLLFALDPARSGYAGERLMNVYNNVLERIHGIPGVTSATLNSVAPLSNWSNNTTIHIVGGSRSVDSATVRWGMVGPDFFQTMQIPVLMGRDIALHDTSASPRIAVVDDTFARRFFGTANPLGQRFNFTPAALARDQFEIVGVVKAAELTDVHADPLPKAYIPYSQIPGFVTIMYFEVRANGNPGALISGIRKAVSQVDPNLPLMNPKTQIEQTDEELTGERLFARLSTFFGLLALLLAAIGLYGTIAYSITRKTREIGIRMALGERPRTTLARVLGQGFRLTLIGAIIGVGAAYALTRLIGSMIYGVTVTDPLTFCAGIVLLVCVTLLASFIPARRAAKVDPMVALRYE